MTLSRWYTDIKTGMIKGDKRSLSSNIASISYINNKFLLKLIMTRAHLASFGKFDVIFRFYVTASISSEKSVKPD
jgi:hypothetical protein